MLGGGLRPWSQTMVSEGATPCGRGRSGDCDCRRLMAVNSMLAKITLPKKNANWSFLDSNWMHLSLGHQNRTIAIASDSRIDGAKSPEIPQKEGVLGSEIAA